MANLKHPTTYDEQLDILRQRGCFIADEVFCKQVLESINYYRFTAYFLPFKQKDGSYTAGTSFHRVYRIYEFDRKLRGVLFSAVEEVEIHLRAKLAYFHAHKYGENGYLNANCFSDKHNVNKFEENFGREIHNNKKALFVKHHLENYDGEFPIWVATELFTFGMLSNFYGDMKTPDQKELSAALYHTTPKNVISWLRCCTDTRNICAHYGRLYYRIFTASPAGLDMKEASKRRLFGCVSAIKMLYPNTDKWNVEVLPILAALVEEYRGDISLYHLAFPTDWESRLRK